MNIQIQILLQQAIESFQNKNFDRATSFLVKILEMDDENIPAFHILGLIKASQAQYNAAAKYLSKAAQLNPNDASIQYNLAKALLDDGSIEESIPHHKKAVDLAPNNPEAWLNFGKANLSLLDYKIAMDCFERALAINPSYAEALLNKGTALKELHHLDEALYYFERALGINSNLAEAWSNKALILQKLMRYEEALQAYDKALFISPKMLGAWGNRGVILHEMKCYEEAIASYEKVLDLNPDDFEVWSNMGTTLIAIGNYVGAIALFDRAIASNPNHYRAWSNRAVALKELKRYGEAIDNCDKTLSLKPDHAEAWVNKAATLNELERYEESYKCYEKALILNPDIAWICGEFFHLRMKMCYWNGMKISLEQINNGVQSSKKIIRPFSALAAVDNPVLHKKCAQIYANDKFPFNPELGPIPKRLSKTRLRIGYFSADLRNHPVSILTAELFELHDRAQFETYAFSYGADDRSPIRSRIANAFTHFIDVTVRSDKEIAQLARELEIDIAIDLGGYTNDSRVGIFAYRAAPIQLSYVGYLGTMGAYYYDYLLADKTIIPEALKEYYSEKIAYLPSYQVNDRKRIISEKQFTKEELGLPETSFVFCCFNNNYKISPSTFDVWMRIIKAVEGSVLFLYADNEWSKANLIKEAKMRGVDSARLIFGGRIPADEYLARYQTCDLFLDTAPYNAGTTASDALWSGLPVLTMIGESFPSRVAASLLNAIGMPELITNNSEEYEALAIELARDPEKLVLIKQKLEQNRLITPLFDTPKFTKSLEAAYMKMFERYQMGLEVEDIDV